jgi:hypothetical protein
MNITLNIPDNELTYFLQLIKNHKFIKIVKKEDETDTFVPRTNEELKSDLREAFEEIKLYKQGKIQLRDAREALNEL